MFNNTQRMLSMMRVVEQVEIIVLGEEQFVLMMIIAIRCRLLQFDVVEVLQHDAIGCCWGWLDYIIHSRLVDT